MAQAVGTDRKGSVNIELNIIPFVDVMSCLTAFLLVTAVWLDLAHLRNDPAGKNRDTPRDPPPPAVGIVLEPDRMLVTPGDGAWTELRSGDWSGLEQTLRGITTDPKPRVEIGADSPITYQTVIAAMDTTVKAGFPDVGVTDPRGMR